MPLDVRGCTRATLKESACISPTPKEAGNPMKLLRDRDRELQLFPLNEEFLVSASHQLALITSLPFVHTARRYPIEWFLEGASDWPCVGSFGTCASDAKVLQSDSLEEVKVVTRFP